MTDRLERHSSRTGTGVASHAGGLPRDRKGTRSRWLRDRRNPQAGLSVEDLYAGLARTRLRRRPGGRVKYSNLGAGLLGQAVARAAGQPYEQLVRERICRPLGMPDTIITPPAGRRPGWPPAMPAGEGRSPRWSSRRWPVRGRCAPRPPTWCACCGPTSTLLAPPWRPSWSGPSSPGSRWPDTLRSGWAG